MALNRWEARVTKEEFEEFVEKMWWAGGKDPVKSFTIMGLGIGGEAGEVQELLKKHVRDGREIRGDVLLELGDVLYYVTRIGRHFGYSLDDIMSANVDKLMARKAKKDGWSAGPRD